VTGETAGDVDFNAATRSRAPIVSSSRTAPRAA